MSTRGSRPGSLASRTEITVTASTAPTNPDEALAQRLIDSGHLHSQAAIDAVRTTDRHAFLPGVDLESAYKEDAVPIKHDEHGEMISCISAPSIVATQLEQLGAQPGHKVLEAGAATGYNAALLGKIVSPGGQVWTLDVDQDLVAGASRHLAEAGVDNATAVMADGAAGLPEHAPFDRIIFTVGSGDVPVKILDQLAPGGRLVLPMRIRGSISRSFAFERDGETWKTVSCEMATFIPLRKGVCDNVYTLVPMTGEGNVRLETFSEQDVDRDALRTVLDQQQTKMYTGVKFRQGSAWEWLYLYLACVLPNGLSRLPGQRRGFTPHFGWGLHGRPRRRVARVPDRPRGRGREGPVLGGRRDRPRRGRGRPRRARGDRDPRLGRDRRQRRPRAGLPDGRRRLARTADAQRPALRRRQALQPAGRRLGAQGLSR